MNGAKMMVTGAYRSAAWLHMAVLGAAAYALAVGGEAQMMKVLTWFFLSCKRYLRRVPFGNSAPVSLGRCFSEGRAPENRSMIKIAVYAEDREEGSLGRQLAEALAPTAPGKGRTGCLVRVSVLRAGCEGSGGLQEGGVRLCDL